MRSRVPREWASLDYYSARDFLINVLPFRAELARANVDEKVRNLRTNKLKETRELWQASLFAYGIGTAVIGTDVYLALVEDQDFDCVAQYIVGDTQHYVPIQMKELVPKDLNPVATLQAELDKLKKYVDSLDLVVALYLNREFRLELQSIVLPQINVAELWLFGATMPDASRFMLHGNLLNKPFVYHYEYPGLY